MADLHVLDGKVMGGVPLKNDNSWTVVATTLGVCVYNDNWVIYRIDSGLTMDIQTPWTSQVVDTIPVQPRISSISTGFLTGNLQNVVGGEFVVDTSGQIAFTSYNAPLTGNTVPLTRTVILPR